jgi:ribosomal protein L6P/L9E
MYVKLAVCKCNSDMQITASADDKTRNISVHAMSSVGRKVRNTMIGITSDFKLHIAYLLVHYRECLYDGLL